MIKVIFYSKTGKPDIFLSGVAWDIFAKINPLSIDF